MLHNLCLNLMLVCSANTLLFNGNPLLRYDGYYVLADFIEVPNLRERSGAYIKRLAQQYCLGIEVPPEPLFHLVRAAFGQRRKMLRRSLAELVTPDVFDAAGIDSQRRPEELDIAEWGALTRVWLAAQ